MGIKKAMKTKPRIVSTFITHANAEKNTWQEPHSTKYLPRAPADTFSSLLHLLCALGSWPEGTASAGHLPVQPVASTSRRSKERGE